MFGLYGGFVLFILAIVFFCAMQDIQLVTSDYYEQELVYQGQIDKVNRTRALASGLVMTYDKLDNQIELSFPTDLDLAALAGRVTLFRPSNSRYDQTQPVQVDDFGRQFLDTEKLMRGLWRVKIDWRVGETEYYSEELIIVE